MRLAGVFCLTVLAFSGARNALGQAVISAHSGVVNFTEGTVLIDDQPLVPKAGTFSSVHQGSTLRTEKGRAEILLTPGVFLRVDENSAIRMVSNALDNTRIEFLKGAAILDSNNAQKDAASITLLYKGFEIHFPKNGVYRLDSDPAVFETYVGEAEIRADGQEPKKIDESRQFFFGIGMDTAKYGDGAIDSFSEWARNRAETIEADNRAAQQSTADPNVPDPSDPSVLAAIPPIYSPYPPSYSVGSPGVFGAPVIIDNGFYGPFGPVTNLFPANPFTVIYVFPRFYGNGGKHPGWPGGIPPRKSTGYPTLPPLRAGYPHLGSGTPASYGGLQPLRSSYSSVHAPSGRVYVAPPRIASPAVASHPVMVAPIHHR
jgi:hypothetical protein